ncbi:xylulokinase [Afifella pfennigii]|uniref:xylulokinase n=1 Tax=Afifella pfennigii TaxID=209897 RepID=UPI00068F0EE4|nr:FGGY family carbohydrate kinase [Afifella pfennigii]
MREAQTSPYQEGAGARIGDRIGERAGGRDCVLAVDLGGSALKAALYTLEGEELAAAFRPLGFEEDEASGRCEQDPEHWWRTLGAVAKELGETAELARVAAIAVCGFTRTQVFLDARGDILRPAIGFRDSRAAACVEAALADPALAAHPAAGGFNAYHPLARLLWLKAREPENFARLSLVVEPKDFLNLRLTGKARSDAISLFWLAEAMRGEPPRLAALAGLEGDVLPQIGRPADRVGTVRQGLPGALARLAGAAVFCGSNDTFMAVAGLGALAPGRACGISGSSEVLGLLAARPGKAEGLITIPWGEGLWHLGGPGQNGGNALAYIVDRLEPSPRPLAARLERLLAEPQCPQPLLFLPFLNGERVPFWDPDLRAAFLGLSAAHSRGDMVRAVMQGVALLNRTVLERAEAAVGVRAEELRLAGGGAKSATWNQIRADILARPVLVPEAREMGLAGGLALARLGLGLAKNLADAAVLGRLTRYEPTPEGRRRGEALFGLFTDMQPALAEAAHRLVALGRERGATL